MYEQEIMEMKDSVTAMFEDLHRHRNAGSMRSVHPALSQNT